jgi:hypothetical protein
VSTARAAAVARRATGVLACALLAGCAGGGAGAAKASEEPIEGRVVRARTTVAAGQTGLEVITWQVTDDGRRVEDALRAHAEPAVAAADDLALRRNGFILCAVRADRMESLRAALGGSAMDIRTWLGTATTWRELISVATGNSMVEIDGVARERPGANARIMARTWPVPMEDGTRIEVEMVPQLVTGELQSSLVRNANRLAGDVVLSCASRLELQRGTAWVLTCDPAGFVETDAGAAAAAEAAANFVGPPNPDAAPAASGKIGARVTTLGTATLLAAPERPGTPARRTVLVLMPHLGGAAFPVDPAAEPMTPSRP